ncbi:MAG: hypothetical protein H6727_14895 [Myxococcales bacterium]|nr:hypothetical protein [Myxococcales bacterium]
MTVVHTPVQPDAETEEMLSRYLEEDLDADERAAVEVLLEERPEVRAELESLRQTLSLMQRMPTIEAPPDFVQKVKRKVRRQKRIRVDQQHQFRMPYEILGVIVVILMFVLYMLVQQHGGDAKKNPTPSPKAPSSRPLHK